MIMPTDEPSWVVEIWTEYRPFLVGRTVDALRFLTLLGGIVLAHLGQVFALSWLSVILIKWLDIVEQAAAFSCVVAFLIESASSFVFRIFFKKGVAK
jgi:hypothetical protein